MTDGKIYEVEANSSAQKWIKKVADEFGIEEGEVIERKLKIHIKDNKLLAADLYLDGEIDESRLSEYFDGKEIGNLVKAKEMVKAKEKSSVKNEQTGSGKE